jgi:predicted MPP superfamily phosphohydrolase
MPSAPADKTGRIMTFLLVVLTVWTLMHLYVVSRLWNLPAGPPSGWHLGLALATVALWLSFPLSQWLSRSIGRAALPLEIAASVWVGLLFLLLVCLLAADVVTGFGWLMPNWWRQARSLAVSAAGVLAVLALVQGLRPPEVRVHEVRISGLRPEYDGLRIVQLTDLHVGPLLGEDWVRQRVAQVEALRPDLVLVTGDLVDHDGVVSESVAPIFRHLRAPLGVWGVLGNHEYYAGLDLAVRIFDASGITLLRDRTVEVAPGLVLAGIDDLSARRQFGGNGFPVDRTLAHRPAGTTILLSHSPWQVERAAEFGVDLMLSGHTHAGQIWPFTYVVRMMYPYVVGRYEVNGMTLLVSRGTGLWGPPMRLFRPGEITAITLRRP